MIYSVRGRDSGSPHCKVSREHPASFHTVRRRISTESPPRQKPESCLLAIQISDTVASEPGKTNNSLPTKTWPSALPVSGTQFATLRAKTRAAAVPAVSCDQGSHDGNALRKVLGVHDPGGGRPRLYSLPKSRPCVDGLWGLRVVGESPGLRRLGRLDAHRNAVRRSVVGLDVRPIGRLVQG